MARRLSEGAAIGTRKLARRAEACRDRDVEDWQCGFPQEVGARVFFLEPLDV